MMRYRSCVMWVLLVLLFSVGSAMAQTPADIEQLMKDTGWSRAEAIAWGERYYGWGATPTPPCIPATPYTPGTCPAPPPVPTSGCVELPYGTLCVTDVECASLTNPYENGPQQLACTHLNRLRTSGRTVPPTFSVGREYTMNNPYFHLVMRVVGVSIAQDGAEVITCEWVTGGAPFAFRNTLINAETGYQSPWVWAEVH